MQFSALDDEALEAIAAKELSLLQKRSAAAGVQLNLPAGLAAVLARDGKKQGGARQIRHLVQEKVEGPLSTFLLQCNKKPSKVKVAMETGKLFFSN